MQAQQQPLEGRPGAPGGRSRGAGTGAQLIALLLFLGASALVAAFGGLVTASHVNGWYATADTAPWSPPNWVFGLVWTVLYTAMAVAAWLVWRSPADGPQTPNKQTPNKRKALAAYGVQLVLNLLWTPVFFALYPVLGTPALWVAFVIIVALAVAVAVTVVLFGPISRTAGLLMLPYLSWIVFAASLNLWTALHN